MYDLGSAIEIESGMPICSARDWPAVQLRRSQTFRITLGRALSLRWLRVPAPKSKTAPRLSPQGLFAVRATAKSENAPRPPGQGALLVALDPRALAAAIQCLLVGMKSKTVRDPFADIAKGAHGRAMLAQDDEEHAVPEELRLRLQELVAAFVAGDFQLSKHVLDGVKTIDAATAQSIAGQVAAYGDSLTPLSEEVWRRSIYRWMVDHWALLIDLSTAQEPVSDLALHAKLFDDERGRIEVWSVHVP